MMYISPLFVATSSRPSDNIFFSEERERILNELPKPEGASDSDEKTGEDVDFKDVEELSSTSDRRSSFPTAAHRVLIERRKSIPGAEQKKRRKHRRTHGKISFRDLARTIGSRWRELSSDQLERYRRLAEVDMVRYQEDMVKYRKKGGPLAGAGAGRVSVSVKPITSDVCVPSEGNLPSDR